ncbi:hypothetical protein [Desulfosarcina ovata]|uniref:Conjugal transfer protein TraW n=1 Tax=Desulfosarcina ovata subsp. ovata TaxID=2752305 RepID=A0A5K8A4Q2_9BACT|nr:hypothetical protein [Desulfosarcina ovata]BBO87525.1 hypothetical protein DSCOOX_07050 [Desulfosarcina ovata subsp. ovata]BBO88151.1 hypothetical protein DSCOOX_13310 [Desulfosarcina ovata subsp. ovata]
MKAAKPLSYRSVAMGMRAKIAIAAVIVACAASQATAGIRNLGIMGKTYPVVELDALVEIRNKAAGIDWQGILQSPENLRKLRNYRPEGLPRLARARVDRTFLVDMTYTLDFDIPNGRGGILYPAGYTFNPLDYIDYPRTIVVVDASDPEQVDWLESSGHAADPNTRLLITDGIYLDVSSRIDRHVFFVMPAIAKRLQLQAVPAVIRQKGGKMEVREIAIAPKKK